MGHKPYGFSETECRIIKTQIKRRLEMRDEFLKKRSDPCMHAKEAGHVFEPAIQRFMSMKASTLDHFQFNVGTISFLVFGFFVPAFASGLMIWLQRTEKEKQIRSGKLLYKDRLHKFQ